MFQTNTSNFNSTNSKYLSISNYQDFPVIKFTRMKKEKPSYFGNLEKTNYNSSNLNVGKTFNNMSTYYSSSSYPDLVLTNSTNKNFLESKKNFLLSTMYKTKEEPCTGFFPKNRFLNTLRKTDLDNEKTERNDKSEKEKSPEKYHIKNLEFNGLNKTRSNLNLNTTQISNFISPSNRFNRNNINLNNHNNNSSSQHIQENSNSNCNNINTNQNNQSFLYSINITNNGFNTTQSQCSYKNNASKYNINGNKVNFGTNTNLTNYYKENSGQPNLNSEFKSVHSGAASSRFGKNLDFINYNKNKHSPISNYNNCITSNNNFSKFQNHTNNYNNQWETEDLKNLKLRNTYNSGVFKSFNKFTKTQNSPSNRGINAFNSKSKEKKKVVNLSDFDQFEIYKENYMKMREEQFLKDTAYFIYDKFNNKKSKKFIFKEIPTNESFKDIIDKITRLVEIKRNNNELIGVEYILNMLREEIENNSTAPIRMKNEEFLLPLINKKSEHAALEFESGLNERKLFQRLKRSKNKFNKNNKSNSISNHNNNNKYFTSCISEEVEHYWEKRNGRNDESIATHLLNKDRLRLNGEKYFIKSKKKKGKKKKVKSHDKENCSYYTDSTTEYYETESYLSNSLDSKGNKKRKRRRHSAGGGEISENSLSENENNESYMDQDLSDLERKRRRRRRRKDKYANLPRTSDIGTKFLGNLEVNLEKEIKFLNTQKNFFMKRLDSFLITQSSGFDGVSDNMLRRTLSILDKYGKKRNKKKKEGELDDNEAMGSQQTDFVRIKAKENYDDLNNNNNTKNDLVTLNTNQNITSIRNSNLNNFNPKGIGNLGKNNSGGAASPAKSPRKKLNLKELKRKKSDANDANKIINNNTQSNKNAETEGKIDLIGSDSLDLLNTEGKFTTENTNENGLLGHLNADLLTESQKTDGNVKPKKTRKRVVKKLKEGCAEGAEEYEDVEIEETDPDQEELEDLENADSDKNLPKDSDVDQVDIGNFKKFMMESLFSGPPAAGIKENEENSAENDKGGVANAAEKKKRKKRNASIENAEIIDEYSNESEYDDDEESSEDQIEEYLETEEYLNTETGEIEVKRIKKTRKKIKSNEENKGEDGNEKEKKRRKRKQESDEAIYNPQLDMLLKMIQEEENKKQVERPEHTIRIRRVLKKKSLLLEPVDRIILTNDEEISEEEYEEVESDDTTESEKNRRAERLRIERERNEIMKKKINDAYIMGINQNLNFLMSQGISESDMTRYQDLLEKIESLKNLDPGNYMRNIKMLLEEFKREEQEIHELKKIERRINEFKYDLVEDRFRVSLARETKLSSLKMRDRTFNTTVSELRKNVIMQRKFTKMH